MGLPRLPTIPAASISSTKEKIEEEINTTSIIRPGEKIFNDYTGKRAAYLADLTSAMELVERTTKDICKEHWYPVFIAVTNGLSWNELSCKYGLELEEDIYDQMLNKFFWLLSIRKGV